MRGDIAPPASTTPHDHKWFFLQTKLEFEEQSDGTYLRTEYAYFVCNNCVGGNKPKVIKRKVKSE